MDNAFGSQLKTWRERRRISQLDLGLSANISTRHLSFLETGRSKPSRPMVLMLCETLDVPHGERNAFLNAAGFAPAYRSRGWSDDDMAPVRAAVDWTMTRHDPYPAFVLDRHWILLKANRSASALLGATGLSEGDSLLDALIDVETSAALFENWQEVMQHMITRLRTESLHLGGDQVLDDTVEKLVAALGGQKSAHEGPLAAVVPARYRAGDVTLSFLSTIAQFGTAEDIALADLKIEMMFPADETTRCMLVNQFGKDDDTAGSASA